GDRTVGCLLWGLQQQRAGEVCLAMHRRKDARAGEERMCFIDVGTAHGKVPGVDHVLHHQRPLAWSATPGMVAGLADFHRTALALGADGFDLTGEISNKIASGNPGRKGQHLPLRVGIQHGQRDAQPVSCEVMRHQRIEYGFVFHSAILTSKGDGMSAPMVKSEVRGRVALITLDRPKALNALSNELIDQLAELLRQYDADENIGAMVLTGSEKAFAAGADIAAMQDWTYMDVYKKDYLGGNWESLKRIRKPIIAAVSGYALGGGCGLAMLCDFIIAAENAKFGQPEIKLGVIPGFGGTQRLARAVGKAKAMDLLLTGRMMDADEAER